MDLENSRIRQGGHMKLEISDRAEDSEFGRGMILAVDNHILETLAERRNLGEIPPVHRVL